MQDAWQEQAAEALFAPPSNARGSTWVLPTDSYSDSPKAIATNTASFSDLESTDRLSPPS